MKEDEDEYITLFLSTKDRKLNIELLVLKSNIKELLTKLNNKDDKELIEINSFFHEDNLDKKIRSTIHELGIPSNLKGYKYIIDSIEITISKDIYITNDIYRMISMKYRVSVNSIEHAIRKAINYSFCLGNLSLIHKVFGYSINDVPTNTQYILMVSEYISLQLN